MMIVRNSQLVAATSMLMAVMVWAADAPAVEPIFRIRRNQPIRLAGQEVMPQYLDILGHHPTGGTLVKLSCEFQGTGRDTREALVHILPSGRCILIATTLQESPAGRGIIRQVSAIPTLQPVNAVGHVLCKMELSETTDDAVTAVWNGNALCPLPRGVQLNRVVLFNNGTVLFHDGPYIFQMTAPGDRVVLVSKLSSARGVQSAIPLVSDTERYAILPTRSRGIVICLDAQTGSAQELSIGDAHFDPRMILPGKSGQFILPDYNSAVLVDAKLQTVSPLLAEGRFEDLDGYLRRVEHVELGHDGEVFAMLQMSPRNNPKIRYHSYVKQHNGRWYELARYQSTNHDRRFALLKDNRIVVARTDENRCRQILCLQQRQEFMLFGENTRVAGMQRPRLQDEGYPFANIIAVADAEGDEIAIVNLLSDN
ncbi:MAG: hypothetical protein R3C28_28610 [Pirellulaceae bacterium]